MDKQTRCETPTWEKDFECGCGYHRTTLTLYKDKLPRFDSLFICIYEHKSAKTGKLYKKPKLTGDLVIQGRNKIQAIVEGLNETT